MDKQGKRKTVLRAGFDGDFTIFYAERITIVARPQDNSEEVEWSDDPAAPRHTILINTIVLLGVASFVVSLLTAAR